MKYPDSIFDRLYKLGHADPVIARLTGYSRGTVWRFRKNNNLPPNSKGGRPSGEEGVIPHIKTLITGIHSTSEHFRTMALKDQIITPREVLRAFSELEKISHKIDQFIFGPLL